MIYILMFLPFHLCFKWMILNNYRKRRQGLLPDEWYWIDKICGSCNHYVKWY